MISETPQQLIDTLREIIDARRIPLGKQVQALEELFALFTTDRARMRRVSYLDVPRYRSAYLRYHVPLNFARCACVLREVRKVHPELDRLERVVDLGAGPGSASLATVYGLPAAPARRYALYDRSRAALKVARRLLEATTRTAGEKSAGIARTRFETRLLPPWPRPRSAALVWMSMLLNELRRGPRTGTAVEDFVDLISRAVAPASVLIVVEPALRAPGRRLLELHDALVAAGGWQILAPCTHNRPCPLLRLRSRPWCHFRFDWRPPEYVREVAAPLGLTTPSSSLAFLAARRAETVPDAPTGRGRLIGDVMTVRNGERGIYVCTDGERQLLSPAPRGAGRGDVVARKAGGSHHRLVPWESDR